MGCLVQVVNLSGTCLCVSGVISTAAPAIEKATITSAIFDSGVNVFLADIVPTNTPCMMLIQLSYGDPGNSATTFISITNGGITFSMHPFNVELGTPGNLFDSRNQDLYLQHTQILLHSGDTMNMQFDQSSTFIHNLRITEIDNLVGR